MKPIVIIGIAFALLVPLMGVVFIYEPESEEEQKIEIQRQIEKQKVIDKANEAYYERLSQHREKALEGTLTTKLGHEGPTLEEELEKQRNRLFPNPTLEEELEKNRVSLFSQPKEMDELLKELEENLKKIKQQNKKYENLEDAIEERKSLFQNDLDFTTPENSLFLPEIAIVQQTVSVTLYDSKNNAYNWSIPLSSYEDQLERGTNFQRITLSMPDGSSNLVGDYRPYVGTSFTQVIDDVWNNSANESEFLYEIWFMTSRHTVYSEDIGEFPRVALDTLARGGGDCEDLTILLADMIRSSSHTKSWKVSLVYFDANNPENPVSVNHLALGVDTGKNYYVIESTAKTVDTLDKWTGVDLYAWYLDI